MTRYAGNWVVLGLSVLALAVQEGPPVRLANDSDAERQVREQLLRLRREHDLTRWEFAPEILIDQDTGIPHSHPVLTMNVRYVDDDAMTLSTYVHENLHWYVSEHAGTNAAIAEFEAMFPDAPGREGGGARDPHSSRLHLIVCHLEYEAMSELIGREAARALLGGLPYYKWVYERVLGDARIAEVLARHGIGAP